MEEPNLRRPLRITKLTEYALENPQKQSEEIIEVENFPTKEIPYDGIFRFHPEVAKTVSTLTHGIHEYAAKFIPQIPRWAIRFSKLEKGRTLLDPFAGCGTSLVEARICGINSYAADVNPLAQLLTSVKSTPLHMEEPKKLERTREEIIKKIENDKSKIDLAEKAEDIHLHFTWRNWFSEEAMAALIKIKRNISDFEPTTAKDQNETENIRKFLLITLSATMKRVSYLDETQIKVRKAKDKFKDEPPHVDLAFKKILSRNVTGMIQFSRQCAQFPYTWAKVIGSDARRLDLSDESIDLVITSPPYINAIDYTMAHKYNLFLLDLVMPESFKKFCRNFIGITERVVYKRDCEKLKLVGNSHIDEIITRIYDLGLKPDVDKNRAFVVYQYFEGMKRALKEMYRVLNSGSYCIIVLGDNKMRKVYVPTHLLVQELAEEKEIGFRTVTRFYHRIQARKLGINRNHTGGKIKDELIMVLQKPV